jgi:hypothetical protein
LVYTKGPGISCKDAMAAKGKGQWENGRVSVGRKSRRAHDVPFRARTDAPDLSRAVRLLLRWAGGLDNDNVWMLQRARMAPAREHR